MNEPKHITLYTVMYGFEYKETYETLEEAKVTTLTALVSRANNYPDFVRTVKRTLIIKVEYDYANGTIYNSKNTPIHLEDLVLK